jgi:arabinose-5-phosphate isomerase
MSSLETGKRVLTIEARTLTALAESLDESFDRALDILEGCKGKVVLTGMGKSGIICKKIAATLSSTGTPAFFLHPAEGAHGDLGVLSHDDVMVALSNSGESSELVDLLPLISRMGLKLISMTGVASSTLARRAEVLLKVEVEDEACPLNLAPMASTTAALAMGDALAAALMERRGVSAEDFAKVHPAGSLGRRLTLKVEDLMVGTKGVPRVLETEPMREAICVITEKGLGFTGVFDDAGLLKGIITDGDIRRGFQKDYSFLDHSAGELMSPGPKSVPGDTLAVDALRLMEEFNITSLFVTGPDSLVFGAIHIHHLVKAGL